MKVFVILFLAAFANVAESDTNPVTDTPNEECQIGDGIKGSVYSQFIPLEEKLEGSYTIQDCIAAVRAQHPTANGATMTNPCPNECLCYAKFEMADWNDASTWQSCLFLRSGCDGRDDCCSRDNLCEKNEGDCDSDYDCAGTLKCGEGKGILADNCKGPNFDPEDDCCYDPDDYLVGCDGGDSCCTSDKPCGEMEGDCDTDDQCLGHLLCGQAQGQVDNCPRLSTFDPQDDCCFDPDSKGFTNRGRRCVGDLTCGKNKADYNWCWEKTKQTGGNFGLKAECTPGSRTGCYADADCRDDLICTPTYCSNGNNCCMPEYLLKPLPPTDPCDDCSLYDDIAYLLCFKEHCVDSR